MKQRWGRRAWLVVILALVMALGGAGAAWAATYGSTTDGDSSGSLQVAGLVSVTGVVTDATTGDVLAGATITFGTAKNTTSGEGGTYTVADIQEGSYTITATLAGYRTRSISNLPVRGTTDPPMILNIALAPNGVDIGKIEGYVVDISNGNGISGMVVQAGGGLLAVTGATGLYSIIDVPQYESYPVSALPPSGSGWLSRSIGQVRAGAKVDLALATASGAQGLGSITGKVVEVIGEEILPLPGARVTAGFGLGAVTDDSGNFTINNLMAGTYYLQASNSNYAAATTDVVVTAGGSTDAGSLTLVAAPGAGWIEGVIQNANGARLNGVAITVGGKIVLSSRRPGYDTAVANQGYFRLEGIAQGQYTLEASLAGYRTRTTNMAVVKSGMGSSVDITLVSSDTAVAAVTGTVRSVPAGSGIADARVKLSWGGNWGLETLTASDGSFSLNDVPVGAPKLEVTATDYRTRTINNLPVQPDTSGILVYDVALTPSNLSSADLGVIKGYVVDISDRSKGLSGVWVQAGEGIAAVTDTNGWYQINEVPLNYRYTVTARPRPGYGFLGRSLTEVSPGQTADLTLAPQVTTGLGSISGRVARTDGAAIAGASVTAGFGLQTVTDADGNYLLDNLTVGTYYLQAYKSGNEAATGQVELVETAMGATQDFILSLQADAGWIEGYVQRPDSTRLNGVAVAIAGKTVVTSRKPGSADQGYFAVYGLAPGQHTLEASITDYRTRTTNAVVVKPGSGSSQEVLLVNEAASLTNLSGVVRSATGGMLVGGALVKAGWGLSTLTAPDGSYSLPDIPAGITTLQVSRDAYRTQTIANVPMPVGDAYYDLALVDNSVDVDIIRGYVVDIRNRNQGLGGVWVQAADGLAAVTDSTGLYQINNVPKYYEFNVEAIPRAGYGSLGRGQGPVKAGANVDLALTPDTAETGSLQGQVVSAVTGAPVPGTVVRAGFGLVAITDANGRYSFANLIPAIYHLQANKSVYEASTGSVKVTEHQQFTLDFQLNPSATAGTVYGYAYYGDGKPGYYSPRFDGPHLNDAVISIGGRQVITSRAPGNSSDNVSNGYYALYGLAPGTYSISFMKSGYQVILDSVSVSANGLVRKDFDPPAGSNAPIVTLSSPASGAQVQGKVDIAGTVIDEALASYTLSFAPVGTENWSEIVSVPGTPIVGGLLGQWDTSSLQQGNYRLRLVAVDTSNQNTTKEITVTVMSWAPVSITAIDPSGAVEGSVTTITIRGTGLATGTVASIGGIKLQGVTVDAQGTMLTGTLPPQLLAGMYDLKVEAPQRSPVAVTAAFKVVAENDVTNLFASQAQTGPGGQTWVDIRVEQVANLFGMELELAFDPQVATITNVQQAVQFNLTGDGISGDVFSVDGDRLMELSDTNADGVNDQALLRISATRSYDQYGYAGFNGSAVLARVLFTGVAEGQSAVTFKYVELRGNAGGEGSEVELLLPLVSHPGKITVTTETGLYGRVDLEGVPAVVEDHNRFGSMGIATSLRLRGTTDAKQPDGSTNFVAEVQAAADGSYSFSDLPAGVYRVSAHRRGYLNRLVATDVRVDPGVPVNLGTTLLLTGDLGPVPQENQTNFGDNLVDLSDLIILRNNYGWLVAGNEAHALVDLDWNGRVGLVDLVLLARNYSKQGYQVPVAPALDTALPVLVTAVIEGSALTLTYDEQLDAGSVPLNSDFTVRVDGGDAVTPTNVVIAAATVTLTIDTVVSAGDPVTLSYILTEQHPNDGIDNDSDGETDEPDEITRAVKDPAGNWAANLVDQVVSNNTGI